MYNPHSARFLYCKNWIAKRHALELQSAPRAALCNPPAHCPPVAQPLLRSIPAALISNLRTAQNTRLRTGRPTCTTRIHLVFYTAKIGSQNATRRSCNLRPDTRFAIRQRIVRQLHSHCKEVSRRHKSAICAQRKTPGCLPAGQRVQPAFISFSVLLKVDRKMPRARAAICAQSRALQSASALSASCTAVTKKYPGGTNQQSAHSAKHPAAYRPARSDLSDCPVAGMRRPAHGLAPRLPRQCSSRAR